MSFVKKYGIFLFLFVFIVMGLTPTADARRETYDRPPTQFNWQSADSPFALRIEKGRTLGSGGWATGTRRFEIKPDGQVAIFNSSGATVYELDGAGVTTFNSSGTFVRYMPHDSFQIIDDMDDLSSWTTPSTEGISYFQCSPNMTYIVDPVMIAADMGVNDFSAVTAVLPNAAGNEGATVKIVVAITGDRSLSSGHHSYTSIFSGSTVVYVYPYAGTGATQYGAGTSLATSSTGLGVQNMIKIHAVDGDNLVLMEAGSGTSYWYLNKVGESATFMLTDSATSAYPIQYTPLTVSE